MISYGQTMLSHFWSRKLRFLIIVLALVFTFWGLLFRNKVMPGVSLGQFDVSGQTREELHAIFNQELLNPSSQKVTFIVSESESSEQLELTLADLGIKYNLEMTAESVYQTGRDGSHFKNLLFRVKAPFVKTIVSPVYYLDASLFASRLETLFANYTRTASNATIVFASNNYEIEKEKKGKVYDRQLLVDEVRNRVENISKEPIFVSFVEIEPLARAENANRALEKVKTLASQKIVLVNERDRWNLAGNQLLSVLDFVPKGGSGEAINYNLSSTSITLGLVSDEESKTELDIALDEKAISDFVDEIGNSIDVKTVNASLVFDGERVTQFTPARDGKSLDRALTRELILSKVSIDNVSGEREIVINLPVEVTRAKIASEEINSLGIKELVGRGVSYFGGSIANRIHNLSLGANRISGTIVKPGEVFSFNKSVGEVSGETGYKPAYVISSGRTVLDDGGGICQVSTTAFRAALNAGLPIVARTAHAYRVGYYEQRGFKAGLDATVWSPAVDFIFKNDTDNHLLVQAVVDSSNSKLQVDIYGTSDVRRVEMSEPVVSNIRPAPEPRYQDDPSLPAGTIKQVDFAAQGATSVFTRKVYKSDNLILDDIFKSNFRPWQAVYLVGTGS